MPAVFPVEWEPLAKTGRYRHMARRDQAVWERWLDKHGAAFEAVAYDVALGGVIPTDPTATDAQRRGFQYATALKIDALLRRADYWLVVEVRPEASVSAVGAVLVYRLMVQRERLTPLPVRGAVVCETLHPDIAWALTALTLAAFVV